MLAFQMALGALSITECIYIGEKLNYELTILFVVVTDVKWLAVSWRIQVWFLGGVEFSLHHTQTSCSASCLRNYELLISGALCGGALTFHFHLALQYRFMYMSRVDLQDTVLQHSGNLPIY